MPGRCGCVCGMVPGVNTTALAKMRFIYSSNKQLLYWRLNVKHETTPEGTAAVVLLLYHLTGGCVLISQQ